MQPRPPVHFDIPFTPRTKKLLIGLLILYIVEIIAGQIFLPLSDFAWNVQSFQIWQPITSFFILDTLRLVCLIIEMSQETSFLSGLLSDCQVPIGEL